MKKFEYDQTMETAYKKDRSIFGGSGVKWLAEKSQEERSQLKAVAMINRDQRALKYLDQVESVVQNTLVRRLSL